MGVDEIKNEEGEDAITFDGFDGLFDEVIIGPESCAEVASRGEAVAKISSDVTAEYHALKRPSEFNIVNRVYLSSLESYIAKGANGNHLDKLKTAKLVIKIALALSSIEIDEYDGELAIANTFLIDIQDILKVLKGPVFEENGNDHLTMIYKRNYFLGLLHKVDPDTLRLLHKVDPDTLRQNIRRQLYAQSIQETIDKEVNPKSIQETTDQETNVLLDPKTRIFLRVTGKAAGFAHYTIHNKDEQDTFIKQFRQILQALKKPIQRGDHDILDYDKKLHFLDRLSQNDILLVVLFADLS